jgi:hypothetical protein
MNLEGKHATVEFGNIAAIGADHGQPCLSRLGIPDIYTHDPSLDVEALQRRVYASIAEGVVHDAEGAEALLTAVHPTMGMWGAHSRSAPSWVACDSHPELAEMISRWHGGVPTIGKPDDVEDTHWTPAGPPGVVPGASIDLKALLTNDGREMYASMLGSSATVGYIGTATASSATSLTATGTPWGVNAYEGMFVVAGNYYANIISNTSSVLTVDQWYSAAAPGGTFPVGPPGATALFVIMPSALPAVYIGLNNANTAPAATDVSCAAEITSVTTPNPASEANTVGAASSGCVRKIAAFALTSGTSPMTFTLTASFTGNASDNLPGVAITVYGIGVFNSAVISDTTDTLLFHSLFVGNSTATLSQVGDVLVVTETGTGS